MQSPTATQSTPLSVYLSQPSDMIQLCWNSENAKPHKWKQTYARNNSLNSLFAWSLSVLVTKLSIWVFRLPTSALPMSRSSTNEVIHLGRPIGSVTSEKWAVEWKAYKVERHRLWHLFLPQTLPRASKLVSSYLFCQEVCKNGLA